MKYPRLPESKDKRRKVTRVQAKAMIAFRGRGWSWSRIARRYKVTPETVKYWVDTTERATVIRRTSLNAKARYTKLTPEEKRKLRQHQYVLAAEHRKDTPAQYTYLRTRQRIYESRKVAAYKHSKTSRLIH